MTIKVRQRSVWLVHAAVIAALMPLVAAAAYVGVVRVANLDRFDPAYFTPALSEEYSSAGNAADGLADALGTNDQAALARVEGLRHPVDLRHGTKLRVLVVRPIEQTTYYRALIAYDRTGIDYETYYFAEINGRWVAAPDDAYYMVDSGKWAAAWLPLAILWWLVEVATLIVMTLGILLRRERARQTGLHDPG